MSTNPLHPRGIPSRDRRNGAKELAVFAGQWMRAPGRTGAVAPSSRHLARAVSSPVPERGDPVVVELGAGTGPFTEEIQRRLGGRGRHLAIELNPLFTQFLRRRCPGAEVIQDDVASLPRLLHERGIGHADVVVSGLPWALFPASAQRRLLEASATALGPQGAFTTFAYLHAIPMSSARRFRELLADRFEEVVPSRTVWRNSPPAYVLHARRPRP